MANFAVGDRVSINGKLRPTGGLQTGVVYEVRSTDTQAGLDVCTIANIPPVRDAPIQGKWFNSIQFSKVA